MESLIAPQAATNGFVLQQVHGQDPDDRVRDLERQLTTLREALESRDTIGMAKGILMARENCTPDEAFDMLKNASQRTNRKLAEIAAEMVQSNGRRRATSGRPAPAGGSA